AKHLESISQTCDAKPNASLGLSLKLLTLSREQADVENVVEESDTNACDFFQTIKIEVSIVSERLAHKPGKVDGTEVTVTIRRKRLLPTRVGSVNVFAIPEIVPLVHTVDENDPRLRIFKRGPND